ncbi:hypothetical protein RP20_CCG001075 [Aedes albopictus]|nr:hypothetical protein RP20_CCG001075 [Aedes albopictus]
MANLWLNHLRHHIKNIFKLTPSKNHFCIVSFFHAIACVNLTSKQPLLRWIWNAYRACMVLHYVLCGIRFSMTVRTSENFNSVMNNMHVIITFTINNMRSFIIFANFEHFARVKNFINNRKYRKDHAGSGEVRRKTYEHAVKVTMFFVGNVIFQALSFLISGMANTEPFLIPMELGFLPYFAKEAVEFCYSMLFLTAPFFAASNFLSLYLAIIGVRAELRIALDSIGSIPDRVNQHDYANDANEKFDQGDEFWNVLHSEMKYSIEHHVQVLDHLNIFKNVTNYSFLLLYYMTMLQIAAGVLIVIFNPVVDLFYILSIDYSFRYTLECFVFCYMVSSLNEIQLTIGDIISHQPWISRMRFNKQFGKQYRSVRANLLIELTESQRQLGINCGGMFEFTLEKFTHIIKTSYSITMFLWTFRK